MEKKLPYQMEVYFDEFPDLDAARLARFMDESDPGEDPCEVSEVTMDAEPPEGQERIRVSAFSACLGDMMMAILVHGVPSPTPETIEYSRLPKETQEQLLKHKAFALLTSLGGEEYAPYEHQIFLLKMAMAMCDQKATGAGFPHLYIAFPAELLLGLLDAGQSDSDDDESHSIWESVREEGEPMQLFADIRGFEAAGSRWLVTRGFAFCGFPDLLYRLKPDEANLEEVTTMFENAFPYMMQNGPVIEAGHTMGYDESVSFRFSEPPADLEIPFETFGQMLLVTRETTA